MKDPLIMNFKGKLQKPFDFFLRCQTRRIWVARRICWLKSGIGQFNCDNRSQQHVEAMYEVLILSVPHVPPEKHPTENGVIAGKL